MTDQTQGTTQGAATEGTTTTTQGTTTQGTTQDITTQTQAPWYGDKLDRETVDYISGHNFGDLPSLVKSAKHFETLARDRNAIAKPDPKKPQEWTGFTELGWTEDPAKYAASVKPPKADAAKGEIFDEQMFGETVKSAHKHKVAPWQAEGIYADVFASINKRMADMEAAGAREVEQLQTALRQEWGADLDAKLELGKRAFAALGLKPAEGKALQEFLGSSPAMAKAFAKIGEMMGEDTLRLGDSGGGLGGKTPASARAERLKLEADKDFMAIFNDPQHTQHKDYVARRQRLIEIEAKQPRAA